MFESAPIVLECRLLFCLFLLGLDRSISCRYRSVVGTDHFDLVEKAQNACSITTCHGATIRLQGTLSKKDNK